MTISELERYASLVPGPDDVANTVMKLCSDWRMMWGALFALQTQSWNQSVPLDYAQTTLNSLKLKP